MNGRISQNSSFPKVFIFEFVSGEGEEGRRRGKFFSKFELFFFPILEEVFSFVDAVRGFEEDKRGVAFGKHFHISGERERGGGEKREGWFDEKLRKQKKKEREISHTFP